MTRLEANDVSMIVAAHVGVGLSGKEGAQAAYAADFALPEFRLSGKDSVSASNLAVPNPPPPQLLF